MKNKSQRTDRKALLPTSPLRQAIFSSAGQFSIFAFGFCRHIKPKAKNQKSLFFATAQTAFPVCEILKTLYFQRSDSRNCLL